MKKIRFPFTILLLILLFSCGDYLDVVPDNVATIDYSFRNRISAEKYLFTCYSYLPHFGDTRSDPAIMGSDEIWIHDLDPIYEGGLGGFYSYNLKRGWQNVNSPHNNFWDGENRGTNLFIGIRDCNIFLENIDNVQDISVSERERWIAEVKFLKAYYHYYLLRMYGPIPIIDKNLPISASVEEVRIFREPFDNCLNYIVTLLDEAADDLPMQVADITTELGRITKPIALAVKAEALVAAASPLFNGNTAYSGMVDSRGIPLFSQEYDENKWKIAMDACKNAIDTALLANHHLYEFNDLRYPVSEETKRVMSARNAFGERWNQEIIWGMPKLTLPLAQGFSIPCFTMTHVQNVFGQPILSAPIHIAEQFYSKNGVPIEEDPSYNYASRYKTSFAKDQMYHIEKNFETANLNQNREPRFYANLGFDGGIWFGNGRYKDVGMGSPDEISWVVHAKNGEVSGKTSSIRYSVTGYFIKKYSHFETGGTTSLVRQRMTFPIIRLADLYLLYAEARNEFTGPDGEVYEYLDKIRKRSGLEGVVESWEKHSIYPGKPSTKEGLRQIIQQERMIELAFEGKRFWDIRRWKIADQLLNRTVKGWNIKGSTTIEYYNIVPIEQMEFTIKEYLWPLKQQSLRVNPNLIQNPYW
jgi:hypothetical protein